MCLRVLLVVILNITEKLASSTFLEYTHERRFQGLHRSNWHLLNLCDTRVVSKMTFAKICNQYASMRILYLPFNEDIASINSFERQILCNVSVNKGTNKLAISHHKLVHHIERQTLG